jgi:hypothetical protein
MTGLIAVIAFFLGIPMFFIGWIWSVVVARQVSSGWMIALLLLLPAPLFALMHWGEAKKPFWVMSIGALLIVLTLLLTPEN